MKIHLVQDWHDIMRRDMAAVPGLKVADGDIAKQYFSYKSRILHTKPRQVLRAAEFFCPQDWMKGLNKIIHKLENGSDMSLHMEFKTSPDETAEDFLLADWGIYHFDLKKRVSGDQEEIGPTLFVYFTEMAAYLLTTKGDDGWTVQELLEIMDKNWPQLLMDFRLEGILGQSAPVGSREYVALRRKNKNVIFSLSSGRIVASGAVQYDADGCRHAISAYALKIERYLEKIESAIRREEAQVVRRVQQESGREVDAMQIVLEREKNGGAYIAEAQTHVLLSRMEGLFELQ